VFYDGAGDVSLRMDVPRPRALLGFLSAASC
jgi:hypothetical protein